MIIYNQAHSESVLEVLDRSNVRGFTKWVDVQGRGSDRGEPHYGTHAWPSKNMTILAVVEERALDLFLSALRALNDTAEEQGLRAFVWDAEIGV